jgi:hypothetical protein
MQLPHEAETLTEGSAGSIFLKRFVAESSGEEVIAFCKAELLSDKPLGSLSYHEAQEDAAVNLLSLLWVAIREGKRRDDMPSSSGGILEFQRKVAIQLHKQSAAARREYLEVIKEVYWHLPDAFRHNSFGTRAAFTRTKKYIVQWIFSRWRVADLKRGSQQHFDFLIAAYEGRKPGSRESARFVSEDETNYIEQLLRERLKEATADQLRPWLVKSESIPPALQKVITIAYTKALGVPKVRKLLIASHV